MEHPTSTGNRISKPATNNPNISTPSTTTITLGPLHSIYINHHCRSSNTDDHLSDPSLDERTPIGLTDFNKMQGEVDDEDAMSISPAAVHFHPAMPRPTRESVLQRLSEALLRRSLAKIDLSQRGLVPSDARLVKMALLQNKHLTVLKLGYNHLGDVGASILAGGLVAVPLESLDLGFNDIGDEGCTAICRALPPAGKLQTLYLAGNLIGQDGAMEIADLIRRGSRVQKLYLTGNLLGPEGVTAIADAILEVEERRRDGRDGQLLVILEEQKHEADPSPQQPLVCPSVEELYLGGVGMGPVGCQAIVRLMQHTHRIRVLSLPNCDITDDLVALLSASIHSNRDRLPLEILQLSFNRITCAGMEHLANAFRGLGTLRELLLDNNEISDRGAQHLAMTLLPQVKSLRTLNMGFNQINSTGIKLIMKSVLESSSLLSVSISGNTVDTSAAKSIAYALAYNITLTSLSVVHCKIDKEGQRRIVAGLVSNNRVALREFSGFSIGPVLVDELGFPLAMRQWSNVQILNFVHLMWHHHRRGRSLSESQNASEALSDEEKITDPLNFLGGNIAIRSAPLETTIVVEVAKKAFAELEFDGLDGYSEQDGNLNELSYASPIVSDGIIVEAIMHPDREDGTPMLPTRIDRRKSADATPNRVDSFVASPESHKRPLQSDPERKNRIISWVCANAVELNRIAAKPFDAAEMWQLHQHYFTPVVNESGGETMAVPSSNATMPGLTASSVPEVSRTSSSFNPADSLSVGTSGFSHPIIKPSRPSSNQLSSLPLLKRKVSYRTLGDAMRTEFRSATIPQQPVSLMIEGGPGTHSMPPKNKRARRNRTRISFLPRIKKKLDSSLDSCHERALTTMRQLYFVERAILNGEVSPILPSLETEPQFHLSGDLAADAETIIVDML